MSETFRRTRENFTCGQCGAFVEGDGYTNHCPYCFWSRHVDINPGDRGEKCGGMMEPEAIEMKDREYIIVHRCGQCGARKRNRMANGDSMDVLAEILERKSAIITKE